MSVHRHIAIVAPEFPPELGGMQTYAVEFARELAARGHRVSVFTRRRETPPPALDGIVVHQVLAGRAAPDWAVLREIRADAWHVMNAAYAWLALKRRPTVVSVHGNDFLRPYVPVGEPDLSRVPGLWRSDRLRLAIEHRIGAWRTPRLVRRGLLAATHLLANSRYTEQALLQCFPRCRGRSSAAMVGVGADFLATASPLRQRAGGTRLVTVSRLADERKNVALVLQALATLKDRFTFDYTIVGDGWQRPALERLAAQLGLGGRVAFTGALPTAAVRELLARSDLFVLTAGINPASHEGFGIAYLEANACGTPTLAARLAGAAEAVEDGVSGYFVETPDAAAVAAALGRFMAGEILFDPEACRRFARRFSWRHVVDAALPWYGERAAAALLPGGSSP